MKKIVGLLLVFLFIIPFNAFAFNVDEKLPNVEASENFALLPDSITVEGNYVCVEDTADNLLIQSDDGQIKPLTTCSGDGGYARIDTVFSNSSAVRWEINPRFSTVHTFTGSLIISRYQGGIPILYDSEPISCTGALGGACGATVDLGLPSGTYSVSMVGTAIDATGILRWAVPPCTVGLNVL